MTERFGLGLAGAGWLGECLLKELPRFPELRLAGVQDVAGDVAREVGARYGSPWTGECFEDLPRVPGVDAVILCTPNFCHAPQALDVLAAGKHALVQKPLALNAPDAEAVVAAAQAANRLLMVDMTYRFLETMRAFEEALPRIGRVRRAEAAFHNIYGPGKAWSFSRAQSGGGALIDLGVHLLDAALHLLRPASAVLEDSALAVEPGAEVETRAELALRFDGVPVHLAVSWGAQAAETDIRLDFEGEQGRASWSNVDGSFYRFRTVVDGQVLLDRETALRDDTLRALAHALAAGRAELPDPRVQRLIDSAYERVATASADRTSGAPSR